MKGAIAAGHPLTAEAGARVLEGGGNAVDACIAAAFAAFVAEGPLTGPAGGGFLLAHVEGETTLLDCFFAVPTEPLGEIEHLTVDFGSTTQSYHVGDGSIAVPGLLAGLSEAHRRFGAGALAGARRAGDRARAGWGGRQRRAGVPARDPRQRPAARRGRAADLRGPGPPRHERARRHARADPRRSRRSGPRALARARGRPRRVLRRRARAAAHDDRRTRCADDAAALARWRDRGGGARRLPRERLARRARASAALRLRRRLDRRDRRDDACLGDRRGRERRRALVHARRRLGRPPRRHAAQQHARRVRRDRPRRARAGRAAARA